MKLALAAVLLVTTASACEKQPSKLDKLQNAEPGVSLPTGDLESRVRRLEEMMAKREEAFAFLDQAFEQVQEQNTKPQPDQIYAVDIAQNLANGMVEGSPSAPVTIIEAWDFA
jgi:hypothetical protein